MEEKQPKKVVRLSVHRNTREQREKKLLRDEIKDCVSFHLRDQDIQGFVLVTWNKDDRTIASFDRGKIALGLLPTFVEKSLMRHLARYDTVNLLQNGQPDLDPPDPAA